MRKNHPVTVIDQEDEDYKNKTTSYERICHAYSFLCLIRLDSSSEVYYLFGTPAIQTLVSSGYCYPYDDTDGAADHSQSRIGSDLPPVDGFIAHS